MKNIQTSFLKLTKPIIGTSNWGSVINQNYDKIDAGMIKLQAAIQGIEGQLNEVGTFSFLTSVQVPTNDIIDADYVAFEVAYIMGRPDGSEVTINNCYQIVTGDNGGVINWSATQVTDEPDNNENYGAMHIGSLQSDGFHKDGGDYSAIYYNNFDDKKTQIDVLPDFTAFYVYFPPTYDSDGNVLVVNSVHAFGIEWHQGDLLIKSSKMQDNMRVSIIMRFKQSLGGYYVPSNHADTPNTIVFTKTPSVSAQEQLAIFMPRWVVNGKEQIFTIENALTEWIHDTRVQPTITHKVLDEGEFSIQQSITDVRFFTYISSSKTKAYVHLPYTIYLNKNNTYEIKVNAGYASNLHQVLRMSYVICHHVVENEA